MSTPNPNQTPDPPAAQGAAVIPSWFQAEQDYLRRSNTVLPGNKAVLFDALAAAGITSVLVEFDGYGDSGQMENIAAKANDAPVELPEERIEIFDPMWGSAELEKQTVTIQEAIETLAYAFLRQTHAGWENNDGAYGDFTFDVTNRVISLDYNERYTSFDNYSHEF